MGKEQWNAVVFFSYIIWAKKSGNNSWIVVLVTSSSQEQPCHPIKDIPGILLELWKVTEICGQEATLAQTVVAHNESCSNLSHKNPRRKGHSLKPV